MLGLSLWLAWFPSWWTGDQAFPNTPVNDWFYQSVARAKREHLFISYPDCFPSRRGKSRYEEAVQLNALVEPHLRDLQEFRGGAAETGRLVRLRTLIPVYRRAVLEFAPQLLQIGFKTDSGIDEIERLTSGLVRSAPSSAFLFGDVPENHWSAQAIGDLRVLGLLDGYSPNRFGG